MRSELPIIIGGCHRSGTSLLRRILNSHSRIYCGPEVKFFRDFYGDYFSDPLNHLRYATSARSMLGEAELLHLLGDTFVRLHERAAANARKARWADKCPENVLYLEQWRTLLGDGWLFVHVARNPLDTVASMHEAEFNLTLPSTLERRIAFWRRYTLAGLAFARRFPEQSLMVRYEELVARPMLTLEGIMAWLGESLEPSQLEYNRQEHQTGLEDPKVLNTDTVHSRSAGRWHTVLSSLDARSVWEGTRDVWEMIDPAGHAQIARDFE